MISRKVELNFTWTKHCILSALDNENYNANADSGNIILSINNTKLYVLVVTLPAKENQKQSKLLSKGFERSVCWNDYRTKK